MTCILEIQASAGAGGDASSLLLVPEGSKVGVCIAKSMWWSEISWLRPGSDELQRQNDEDVSCSRHGGGQDSVHRKEFQAGDRAASENAAASRKIMYLRRNINAREESPGKSQGLGRQESLRIRRYPSEATTSFIVVAAVLAPLALCGGHGAAAAGSRGSCFVSPVTGGAGFAGLGLKNLGAASPISRANSQTFSVVGSSLLGLGGSRGSSVSHPSDGIRLMGGPFVGKGSRWPR